MPPSIARTRDPPQPLTEDYDAQVSSKAKQRQTMSDFQARKILLDGGERKKKAGKNKTKATKKVPTSKSTTSIPDAAAISAANAPNSATTDMLATTTGSAGLGGGGMGGIYGGMGGMGGMYGGMMGSPYGMGMGMAGYGTGPLNSLNQFLFGVQTAIYSLSSAVQIIGMNTQALQQLLDAASSMLDHALKTWHELRALEANEKASETEEQKTRRRRLKALRWALVVAASYTAYRILRSLFAARRTGRRRKPIAADPYYNSSNAGYSPYSQSGGYGGMSPYGTGVGGMGGMYSGYGGGGHYY